MTKRHDDDAPESDHEDSPREAEDTMDPDKKHDQDADTSNHEHSQRESNGEMDPEQKHDQNGPKSDHDRSGGGPNDNMDLEQLRLSQDFLAEVGAKKHLATVPIKPPDRQWWVRVHPEWSFTAAIFQHGETRENYLVLPTLLPELPGEAVPKFLFPAVTRQGVFFLWPVRPGGRDGRRDEWSRSSIEAAMLARTKWVRVASNMALRAYEIFTAPNGLSDPVWPDLPFDELLRIAFRDRIIGSLDHPIFRQLRGEL